MSPLVKIRSERDRMSAVERRIADFVLENAQLLRDYSSQQLANALGISQSSVVKFTQKLGFRGYPDLKYSVGEAIGRADDAEAPGVRPAIDALGAMLWERKTRAQEATGSITPPEAIAAAADTIGAAGKVFPIGLGEDELHAHALALRLSLLGIVALRQHDVGGMAAQAGLAGAGDVLVVFSEHGRHPLLVKMTRHFRERRGRVVTVTRHTANPLRAMADVPLVVAAHDGATYVQSLVYQSTVQQLMDRVFVHLCESDGDRHRRYVANLDRIHPLFEP